MIRIAVVASLLVLVGYAGIAKTVVMVSIPPLKEGVEKALGPDYDVQVLLRADQSPAASYLSPLQIQKLSKSDAFVAVGNLPFEVAVISAIHQTMPEMKLIKMNHVLATHRDHHDHHHHEEDPHLWLSIESAIEFNQALAKKLTELSLEAEVNSRAYQIELHQLKTDIQTIMKPHSGKTMVVYHPAFGHFCQEFGLTQLAIEQNGNAPSGFHMRKMIKIAREKNVSAVFVQDQFDQASAKIAADSLSVPLIPLNPLAHPYSQEMRKMAELIAQHL